MDSHTKLIIQAAINEHMKETGTAMMKNFMAWTGLLLSPRRRRRYMTLSKTAEAR